MFYIAVCHLACCCNRRRHLPTTVTSSIGTTGRTYSTLQAWEDAAPANLVSEDKIWRGEMYNDSEFAPAADPALFVGGSTADATRYKELTVAAGQSFVDHDWSNDNLTYDQSAGVGLKLNNTDQDGIFEEEGHFHLSRLQILMNTTDNGRSLNHSGGGLEKVKDVLIVHKGNLEPIRTSNGGCEYVNVLVILDSAAADGVLVPTGGSPRPKFTGCTIIRASNRTPTATGFGEVAAGDGFQLVSCGIFGFSNVTSGGFDGTNSVNNATDLASGLPGSSNQHSVTYNATTPFVQASSAGTLDFRAITGTSLINNGSRDATNAPNDIRGQSRDSTPTIGHWEVSDLAAVLTGTAIGGITEADVVAGGKTIVITLTGDTWIA